MINRSQLKDIKNSTDNEVNPNPSGSTVVSNFNREIVDQGSSEVLMCGWGGYRPNWMQLLNNRGCAISILTFAAFLQGAIVNGMLPLMIPTIEQRFNLRSIETGFISGAFNISSLLCLVPVTYFGGRPNASKPRWIGIGMVLLGIGSLMFSLPYFCTSDSQYLENNKNTNHALCNENTVKSNKPECPPDTQVRLSSYMWVLVTANLFQGAGSSPLFTLGVAFIDESVVKNKSGLFLALYYIGATTGIAFGYFIGGYFLQIPEDFWLTTRNSNVVLGGNRYTIGAWWFGFLLFGCLCLILSFPILAIPARLPRFDKQQEENVSEVVFRRHRTESFRKMSQLPSALAELLKNRSFILLNFAGCCEGLLISGSNAFIPKLLQIQFNISTQTNSMVMGIVTIPSVILGMVSGGLMLEKFDMKFVDILKLCITTTSLSMICTSCFFIHCSNEKLVGINIPYQSNEKQIRLEDVCNTKCQCSERDYSPICGADNNTYYSPCFAGCKLSHSSTLRGVNLYSDCNCIEEKWARGMQASDQSCATDVCFLLPLFLLLLYLTLFFTFINAMPTLSATLRCVKEDQRSLALGIQWLLVRLLGMIPGPVVFGAILDSACEQWNAPSCSEEGACVFYDNYQIGWSTVLLGYHLKTLEISLFMLSIYFYQKDSLRSSTHL